MCLRDRLEGLEKAAANLCRTFWDVVGELSVGQVSDSAVTRYDE